MVAETNQCRMSKHWRYFKYVCKHKWFVFRAGLKTGVPLWRLIIHDWSKFTPAEWGPYANRFFGGRSGVEDKEADPNEFKLAWLHHVHNNPHHWEHWILRGKDSGREHVFDMPEKIAREMVADWMGAGRAINGSWNIEEWYKKTRPKQVMTMKTRHQVDTLVAKYGSTT